MGAQGYNAFGLIPGFIFTAEIGYVRVERWCPLMAFPSDTCQLPLHPTVRDVLTCSPRRSPGSPHASPTQLLCCLRGLSRVGVRGCSLRSARGALPNLCSLRPAGFAADGGPDSEGRARRGALCRRKLMRLRACKPCSAFSAAKPTWAKGGCSAGDALRRW